MVLVQAVYLPKTLREGYINFCIKNLPIRVSECVLAEPVQPDIGVSSRACTKTSKATIASTHGIQIPEAITREPLATLSLPSRHPPYHRPPFATAPLPRRTLLSWRGARLACTAGRRSTNTPARWCRGGGCAALPGPLVARAGSGARPHQVRCAAGACLARMRGRSRARMRPRIGARARVGVRIRATGEE